MGVRLGIIKSSGKMMKYRSIQFRRRHAEPVSCDRKLRERFPIDFRSQRNARDRGFSTDSFPHDSHLACESFAYRLPTLPSSGWRSEPLPPRINRTANAFRKLLSSAPGGSHSLIERFLGTFPLLTHLRLAKRSVRSPGRTTPFPDYEPA